MRTPEVPAPQHHVNGDSNAPSAGAAQRNDAPTDMQGARNASSTGQSNMDEIALDRDDRIYFLRRASEERAKAKVCDDRGVARTHLRMAEEYERRAARLAEIEVPED